MENFLPFVFSYYATVGAVTFAVYARNKSAAKRNVWRTRESTLHLLALIGGWPGAFFAQKLLRHKTRKQPFRAIFWVTVVAHGGLCIGLLSAYGADWRG